MSSLVRRFGWTGWLLVLVYFGALTAISRYITRWFLFSEELSFYEMFIEVIISTIILYILAQVYVTLRNKNSTSRWWARALKMLSVIFGVIGFIYLSIGTVQYFSIGEYRRDDPDFNKLDITLQNSIIQRSSFFAVLLSASGMIAFVATFGLPLRRKFGWYAAVSLILIQIIALTGFLDEGRTRQFVFPTEIIRQLSADEIHEIETVFIPFVTNSVFAMLIANIIVVTFLTLPRILTIFNMPTDILSARISKGH